MQYIALLLITMGLVWYAWINFRKAGLLRKDDAELSPEDYHAQQRKYVMRIVACLLSLAILPFLFTVLTDL